MDATRVAEETAKDPELRWVLDCMRHGWPARLLRSNAPMVGQEGQTLSEGGSATVGIGGGGTSGGAQVLEENRSFSFCTRVTGAWLETKQLAR